MAARGGDGVAPVVAHCTEIQIAVDIAGGEQVVGDLVQEIAGEP
jgi:hypothetical protein